MENIKAKSIKPRTVNAPIQARYLWGQSNWSYTPVLHTRNEFGTHLADGYAPEAEREVPDRAPDTRDPDPRDEVAPISHPGTINKIARPSRTTRAEIEHELAEVRKGFEKFQATNGRDGVYIYLEAVFALIRQWQELNCASRNARALLRLQKGKGTPQVRAEPTGIVIFCTADPKVVDAKTRSKWSRVLRFARKRKPATQGLTEFIKSYGGINACARRFARTR